LHAAQHNPQLAEFIEACRHGATMEAELATQEKKGMATGLCVVHPLTGEKLPVWVANYVLMGYGEGAVMAVPAHDERDFGFATKYELPIKPVIKPIDSDFPAPLLEAYVEHGVTFDSMEFSGQEFQAAVDAIAAVLEKKGLGEKRVRYRLRDWGISRQRYWGCPIPLVYCDECGVVPVPDEQLPVLLPEDLVPDGSGNPLAKTLSFTEVACPRCNKPARRETDGITSATPVPTGQTPWRTSARTTGCRSINISEASSTRYFICSIRAFGPRSCVTSAWSSSMNHFLTC
jgi:leucyl-tRNA synthetase